MVGITGYGDSGELIISRSGDGTSIITSSADNHIRTFIV